MITCDRIPLNRTPRELTIKTSSINATSRSRVPRDLSPLESAPIRLKTDEMIGFVGVQEMSPKRGAESFVPLFDHVRKVRSGGMFVG